MNHYPLVIIGAGAAGLGASRSAKAHRIEHVILEASHRAGGRGLTETLDNGVPVDLGCHWMHCASRNPLVVEADNLGFTYLKDNPDPAIFSSQAWRTGKFAEARAVEEANIRDRIMALHRSDTPASIWDGMDAESPHTPWFCYWYALMHSNDPDQVDVQDVVDYIETGEDWPVRDGYGALIEATGVNSPLHLNTPVQSVDWTQHPMRVSAGSKTFSAEKILVTVSTGVLGAGDIRFDPALPPWKQDAINALPLGNYNNLFFSLRADAMRDAPGAVVWEDHDQCAYIKIRPFGHDMLFTSVAGRFAWWLEKQGEKASRDWLFTILVDLFGESVRSELGRFKASAWGFDPWTRGAYSSLRPGSGPMRKNLAKPVMERIYFAGEATSPDAFNTAHGAWISGQTAIDSMAASWT